MYCPKCGQQQPSGDVRFCSRCGFQLDLVSELITGGVLMSHEAVTQRNSRSLSPRRKGVRQGAKLLFISLVLLPLFFALGFLFDGLAPLVVPLTIFLAGLTRMIYSRLFGEDDAPAHKQTLIAKQSAIPGGSALLPPRSAPVAALNAPRAGTAELMPRGSVTENTTKLLDKFSDH